MWHLMGQEILKAMDTEKHPDILSFNLATLAECIKCVGNGCLTQEMIAELVKIIDRLFTEHFQRSTARQVNISS